MGTDHLWRRMRAAKVDLCDGAGATILFSQGARYKSARPEQTKTWNTTSLGAEVKASECLLKIQTENINLRERERERERERGRERERKRGREGEGERERGERGRGRERETGREEERERERERGREREREPNLIEKLGHKMKQTSPRGVSSIKQFLTAALTVNNKCG